MQLYNYPRSSASYRVRIALALKGLDSELIPIHLLRNEQTQDAYTTLAPSKLVPLLHDGELYLSQSMAIIEYLDETWPDPPLLPATARDRARARAIAQAISCDIHPLNNLRVLQYFENVWNVPSPERDEWVRHWLREGLAAVEEMLAEHHSTGTFCDGEMPGMADCCLVPQVFNARRFSIDLEPYKTIRRIYDACMVLPAFDTARPERQSDAPVAS
jgi:maleylacetoacetate isomerase